MVTATMGTGISNFRPEYLRSTRDTKVRSGEEDVIGKSLDFTSDGLYVQGVYGIFPKLQLGLRYDVFGLTNKVGGAADESFGSSDRWTANLTWNMSEYSRLRAQYARSDILVAEDERERFDAFYLQFLMKLGSHGAHSILTESSNVDSISVDSFLDELDRCCGGEAEPGRHQPEHGGIGPGDRRR